MHQQHLKANQSTLASSQLPSPSFSQIQERLHMSAQFFLPVSHPNFTHVGALMIVMLLHASTYNHTAYHQKMVLLSS